MNFRTAYANNGSIQQPGQLNLAVHITNLVTGASPPHKTCRRLLVTDGWKIARRYVGTALTDQRILYSFTQKLVVSPLTLPLPHTTSV